MKKLFILFGTIGMFCGSYAHSFEKTPESLENEINFIIDKDDVEAKYELGNCVGDIIIFDARGNITNRISFSAPNATSLQDCIGLYQLEVYRISLNLQQGETTGGTVSF